MSRFLLNSLIRGSFHLATVQQSFHKKSARSGLSLRLSIEQLEDRQLLSGGVSEFPILTSNSGAYGITAGPDGHVWFTERRSGKIAKITPTGVVSEHSIPTPPGGWAENIASDPVGNLWYTNAGANPNGIGQVTPGGNFIGHFLISTSPSVPEGITAGPDGNMWFAEYYGHKVGRITLDGVISEFTPPRRECEVPDFSQNCNPSYVTAGPDGNVWFTDAGGNKIGRVNLLHTPIDITEFSIPTRNSNPSGITLGPDGNLWFTEANTNQIGRITPLGSDREIQDSIREITVPAVFDHLYSITAGPDGNLWFVGFSDTSSHIGRITPDGLVTAFPVRTSNPVLVEITAGPDGNLWFTEHDANRIGKLHVLTATGLTLENAVTAGQPLQAVVANFHDDEPGMLGAHYQVDIDWGDGEQSTGQAWRTAGVGNWVATGGHTYAQAGEYTITVTITDTHLPDPAQWMSTTTYSYVSVSGGTAPGGGGGMGQLPPDVVAALLLAEQMPLILPSSGTPATVQLLDTPSLGFRSSPAENVSTPLRMAARHVDAWLGDELAEVLAADLWAK